MKKLTFLILLFNLSSGVLFAQKGFKLGFRFSPQINSGTMTDDSSDKKISTVDYKAKMGFTFGLMVNYGFTNNIGFHTGVHVGTRKFGFESQDSALTFKNNQKITSLYVPIQLKLRSGEIASTGLHVIGLFGVFAELNFSNKRAYTDTLTYPNIFDTKGSNNVTLFSTSFVPSLGVDWDFDWGTLTLAASYHLGLMNVLDKKTYPGVNSRINTIGLDLGYYF